MDKRKFLFGIAVVFGLAGYGFVSRSEAIFGNGTFHANYGAYIIAVGVGFLIAAGICAAAAFAMRKS